MASCFPGWLGSEILSQPGSLGLESLCLISLRGHSVLLWHRVTLRWHSLRPHFQGKYQKPDSFISCFFMSWVEELSFCIVSYWWILGVYKDAEWIIKSLLLPFIDFKHECHPVPPLKVCWIQEACINNKNSKQLMRPTMCWVLS